MTILGRARVGAGVWLSALRTLRSHPRMWIFVVAPLVVYGLLLSFLLYFILSQVPPLFMNWFEDFLSQGWALTSFKILSYIGAIILWALLVVPAYAIANLIMSPVHSLAAEQTLKKGGLTLPLPIGFWPWVKFFFRSLGIGLLKSLLLILASIPLFLGGFLPGVGLFFVFLSFVILAFDCTDYSLEVLGLNLSARFRYLRRYRWEYVGFSFVFFLASFVPLAMLIVLPVGIVAGAHLVLELERSARKLI